MSGAGEAQGIIRVARNSRDTYKPCEPGRGGKGFPGSEGLAPSDIEEGRLRLTRERKLPGLAGRVSL